jgi:hypothetical protein
VVRRESQLLWDRRAPLRESERSVAEDGEYEALTDSNHENLRKKQMPD